jgi:hypothetical protein
MATVRRVALEGYDGTSTQPIAYGHFMSNYRTSYTNPLPSESYVRMQRFGSLAFGCTFLEDWHYSRCSATYYPTMFSADGEGSPTPVFNYVAKANEECGNLGPALVRIVSSGVFMKPGSGRSTANTGVTDWMACAGTTTSYTDRLTGITPYTNSTVDGGHSASTYDDIVIGYFTPLLSDNKGATFADGLLFMIVNGAWGNSFVYDAIGVPATDLAQWYHLTFDFTGSAFDSLVRLRRDTGKVELVPLTHYGSEQAKTYYLDLSLPGGTGDLFAFWNSANALPTIPEPHTRSR